MLALLRGNDAKLLKSAETYLDIALHAQPNHDSIVYQQLNTLRLVRAGVQQAESISTRSWETALQAQLFQALLYYWLALPQLTERKDQLRALVQQADAAGYDLIAAQAAGLLGLMGEPQQERYATAKRAQHGLTDMAPWFERQEAWQRQLSALINLQQDAPGRSIGQRLAAGVAGGVRPALWSRRPWKCANRNATRAAAGARAAPWA